MEHLLSDIRFGFRTLLRAPGPTATAIFTLALAIGLASSIFTLINAILLKPLPFRDPGRLVMVWAKNQAQGWDQEKMSIPEMQDWQKSGLFEQVVGFGPNMMTITGPGESELTHGYSLSAGTFQMLGAHAMLGRTFTADEERPGGPNVVVMRYSIWQRRFGGDPAIVGQKIFFHDRPYTVVGVMPPDFQFFNRQTELFYPQAWDSSQVNDRGRFLRLMARLKPGVTLEDARSRASVIAANFARQYPASNQGWTVRLVPLSDDTSGPVRPALLILAGAVGLVLLIACVNVTNLLLVQGAARSKELAIRLALGSRRMRLIRQLLTESAILSATAASAGFGLAYLAIAYFRTTLPDRFSYGRYLVQMDSIRVDPWVVAFTAILMPACAALFGIIPAWRASKPDLNEALKDTARGSAGGPITRNVQKVFVICEVAMAVALAIGAGLLIQTFGRLYQQGPGFRSTGLKSMMIALPTYEFHAHNRDEWAQRTTVLYRQVLDGVGRLPGIQSVASVNQPPLTDFYYLTDFTLEGQTAASRQDSPHGIDRWATPNYFDTLGIPLRDGRLFTYHDQPGALPVVVINEQFAHRYFNAEAPIGRRIKLGSSDSNQPWHTIVGIVGGERFSGMDEEPRPMVYFSTHQWPQGFFHMVVRTDMDLAATMKLVRAELKRINPKIAPYEVRTYDSIVLDSTWRVRYSMMLLAVLAGASLLLAALGAYSVISYTAAQRTREIGIRMALGARRADVIGMIASQGLRLVLTGIGIGLVISAGLTQFMASLLFGVSPLDPAIYAVVALVLLIAGALACFLPARRASRLEPLAALRHE